MAFRANPSNGEYHNENWRDFYVFQKKYHAMYSPVVTHVTDPSVVRTKPNVTISRHAINRAARRMIKIHSAFDTNGARDTIGLGISKNLAWMDFSNSVFYNSASGVTSYGNGGSEYTNWEKNKAFTHSIWMQDVRDPARGVHANFFGSLEITIVKHEDNGVMVTWQCQHHCQADIPIWTAGKMVINTPIEHITAVDLRSANGTFIDGRMTVEWF